MSDLAQRLIDFREFVTQEWCPITVRESIQQMATLLVEVHGEMLTSVYIQEASPPVLGDVWQQIDGQEKARLKMVHEASESLSQTSWQIGRLASAWKSCGGSLTDFSERIGVDKLGVRHRYEVWTRFMPCILDLPFLVWPHFSAAYQWDDPEAKECLAWANEVRATVPEMKAWRQAQRGEDLTRQEPHVDTL